VHKNHGSCPIRTLEQFQNSLWNNVSGKMSRRYSWQWRWGCHSLTSCLGSVFYLITFLMFLRGTVLPCLCLLSIYILILCLLLPYLFWSSLSLCVFCTTTYLLWLPASLSLVSPVSCCLISFRCVYSRCIVYDTPDFFFSVSLSTLPSPFPSPLQANLFMVVFFVVVLLVFLFFGTFSVNPWMFG